jgi:hypothetical protein
MGVRVRTAEEGALAMKISRILDRRLGRCLATDKISGSCSVEAWQMKPGLVRDDRQELLREGPRLSFGRL